MMWLLMAPAMLNAQQLNKTAVNTVPLHSIHNNSSFTLKQTGARFVALVFISPECPLSQNYMLTLNHLQIKFDGKLTVIGIFPGSAFKDDVYLNFEKKYGVIFKLLKDEKKLLVKKLGASITPEVFLLDSSRQVIYSGAIDDWVVSLGKKRKNISEHFLNDAMEQSFAGQQVQPARTKAIGCFIN